MQVIRTTPAYKHDCDSCRYLATLADNESGIRDVYTCKTSVVIRTGNEGPDYGSMPHEMAALCGGDYARALLLIAVTK